jgi:L-malate glycosyltransferase
MIKILHITPDFNYSCGRSKLAFMYLKHFSTAKNFQIHFITNGGDSLERLKEIPNLKFKIFNFSTGYKNIFYQNSFYKNLKSYLIKNNIGLIHTHHRFPENISVRIQKELNVKTITSAHSFVIGFKQTSFKSDKIISVSNSIANHLLKNFDVKKEKIITIYNPVKNSIRTDLMVGDKFRTENNIPSNKKILLFVGRINRDKGIDVLLKSFSIVRKKIENLFVIVNGQIDDKKLFQQANDQSIIYLPPRNDISNLYAIADLIVLPSRNDPFPYVMLETGAFKKPFLGGNTGGIAEFIEDGKNGLLVDPENPEQLAEKIIYLLNNPDVGKRLGENLHQKVKELCDYNSYFNQVEKIYNELIEAE